MKREYQKAFCIAAVTAISLILLETPAYADTVQNNTTNQSFFASPSENDAGQACTGISVADSYANIRKESNEASAVVGRLYKGRTASITATEGDWVKIASNGIEGYIKSADLKIGDDADKLIDQYGVKYATVTARSLNVRAKMSMKATVLVSIKKGTVCPVQDEQQQWVKVAVDEKTVGYVAKRYINIKTISAGATAPGEEVTDMPEAVEHSMAADKEETTDAADKQVTGSQVSSYALQYVGNPYSWGGSSLTSGTDCSGFSMRVYDNFGYKLNRSSRDQATQGTRVSLDQVQSGDLIFYANSGSIHHVAIYIGDGKIVHACNKNTGIIVSSINFETPYCARRIL